MRIPAAAIHFMSPPSPLPRSQFVIGLAGHIDHGKSALVHALTGANVDRLPEEKRRGITIELGFAHFDAASVRYALIDVPGHERFIHTMVAGASGVDAALLVVAADDSVMPQTREHLALLDMLGVRRGVIAITKCDLVDDEHLGMVDLEVAELVAGTFLADAPRLHVSAHAKSGIEHLRQALIESARLSPPRAADDNRFRLPIDRVFSREGQGAVVTGTVWQGAARVGDMLHLLPSGESVRIRRLQSQGKDVEHITAGERAAINLAGIKASAIRRGDELATPDGFEPARRHLIQLRVLPDAKQGLKHRQFVRVHLGANQTTAQLLMEEREVAPGQSAFAVLRCREPIVAEYGQPLVLRQLSPATTIGGGTFIAPSLRTVDKLKHCLAVASGLASDDPTTRLAAYVALRREATLGPLVETRLGLDAATALSVANQLVAKKELIRAGSSIHVTAQRFAQLKQKLIRRIQVELERRKPASQVPLAVIEAAMSRSAGPGVLAALLEEMVASHELVRREGRIGLPSGAQLSQRQRQFLGTLLAEFAAAGPAPPTLKELAEKHGQSLRDLEPLVQVGVDDGQLVRLSREMAIDRAALESLRQRLAGHFERHPTAKVGEIREQWGITRKHAVPIFEFFDECRVTARQGDLRSAGPRLLSPIGEGMT
jgi:selenocysteine-specific elongation factor